MQVQEFWNKLNANERIVGIGAMVVIISWLVGIVVGGAFGGIGTITLLGAIAVLVILWLKYAPNTQITWPAPIPTLLVGIAGISALLAVLGALQWLTAFGGLSFFGGAILVAVAMAVGACIMAWGGWQEYQAQQKPAGPSA